MKLKKLILSAITALSLFTLSTINTEAGYDLNNLKYTNQLESQLQSNESTLFYMYSNNEGHYFLDPNDESVVYVGLNDWKVDSDIKIDTATLHHGQKFIGTFDTDYDWELTGIKKAEIEFYNEALSDELELNQTTLFYMYSNTNGHYFLDPNAEYENVLYVSKKEIILDGKYSLDAGELHHGERFIGTFTDSTMWELTELERVSYE